MQEIDRLKVEYNSKLDESNGSYFALSVSFSHLENRYKLMIKNRNKESDEQKQELVILCFLN